MVLIALTRLLLVLYGFGLFSLSIRVIALLATGAKRNMDDVGNVLLWPIMLLTDAGCHRLAKTLTEGESK